MKTQEDDANLPAEQTDKSRKTIALAFATESIICPDFTPVFH